MGNATTSPLGPWLERWNALPRARQAMLVAVGVGALVLVYVLFLSSSSPNMVTAFSGLAPEDSAAMVDELETLGVPYELRAGGAAIAVPANQIAEVRIKLAQAGLPAGGAVGLEIFERTNFGATDFVQQVNFRRGLEGELARSINTLDAVKASRVHISIPRQAVFREDQHEATASVLLQLRPGARLTDEQVKGITNLVANSVEGLREKGITIIDDSGRVLFDGAAFGGTFSAGATATQLDLQRQFEVALQRDISDVLAQIVGPGRSAVTIRASLNFDQVTSTRDEFGTPQQAVARSQSTVEETFTGNNLNVGNVPGTGANDGIGGPATGAGGNSQYTRTETTINNEVPRTTSTTIQAPGRLERLSVSVVLDESVTAAQEGAITSAVAAAVGLDQVRGDVLSVTRLPFDQSARADLIGEAPVGLAAYFDYLRLVLPILAVILGFILVMLLLRSLSGRQLRLPAPMTPRALHLGGAAALAALPGAHTQELPVLQTPSDPHEERVLRLAEANPRAVADVVQTWMRED
jgi:flagellar M-ring protein FliF